MYCISKNQISVIETARHGLEAITLLLNVKYKITDALSLWHQQLSTTVDIHGPLPEVRPGAREESTSPAWLAVPAMNARYTTKV